jgi:hypothetical protein
MDCNLLNTPIVIIFIILYIYKNIIRLKANLAISKYFAV